MNGGTRGMTLVECAIGMAAAGVITAATGALLLAGMRLARGESAALASRRSLQAAAAVLRSELSALAAEAGDLVAVTESTLTLRAMRGFGVVCAAPAGQRIVLDDSLLSLLRAVDPARDSVRFLAEGHLLVSSDDHWAPAGIVAAGGGSCSSGASGTSLTLSGAAGSVALMGEGAPVLLFEHLQYRRYRDGAGQTMLGVRSPAAGGGWTATSPIAGPLRATGGLVLQPLDSAGNPSAAPGGTSLLLVTLLRAESSAELVAAGRAADSLVLAGRGARRGAMSRRGFALAAVLFALTVLASLAGTGFIVALQDTRSAQRQRDQLRTRRAAQSVIAQVLEGWDVRVHNALATGQRVPVAAPGVSGVATTAELARLSEGQFLVRAEARTSAARVMLAQPVRLDAIETALAALRTRALDPALTGWIDGVDRAVPGWTCAVSSDTVTAALIQSGFADTLFYRFGRRDWSGAVGWADSVPPGGDSLPVRHAAGDLTLTGGRLLGTLLVDGDLTLQAGAEIVGLALVRGTLYFDGGGGRVTGSVVASQVVTRNGFTPAAPVAVYSSCAVLRAAFARAPARPDFGVSSVMMY